MKGRDGRYKAVKEIKGKGKTISAEKVRQRDVEIDEMKALKRKLASFKAGGLVASELR